LAHKKEYRGYKMNQFTGPAKPTLALAIHTSATTALSAIGLFFVAALSAPAQAANSLLNISEIWGSTHLIEIAHDTPLSLKTRNLRIGGFETSGGDQVSFRKWYSADLLETRLSWMTQATDNFGVIWGLSTGEKAEKYEIEPGLRLGFVYQAQPSKHTNFSVTGSTIVGGRLQEKPCVANYGAIGGVQTVNCRLAASVLPPSETLQYLLNEKPDSYIKIRYQKLFD
jgi:hypothetical protein